MGVSQARSNLCLGAEAGGDVPLQGLCGDDGDSSASLERGGGIPEALCVCRATPTPPFPLLSHPLCHTADTRDPGTFPMQACPLPACHAHCLSRSRQSCQHSHPGPPPCQMGKSPEQSKRMPLSTSRESQARGWQRCRAQQGAEMHCHCPRLEANQQEPQGWQVSVHGAGCCAGSCHQACESRFGMRTW